MRPPRVFHATPILCAITFSLLTFALAGPPWSVALAQPAADGSDGQPSAQPADESYWLRVTGERVNLRSRPDVNSRIVGRVDSDEPLEAVGSEYGWHRVVPPSSVFSVVSTKYIERVGVDRGVVRVETTLRVRVGSDVQPRDPLLSEVQTRLSRGAEVRIVGELDGEWLKIVPPAGVYVYISGDHVERVDADVASRLRASKPPSDSELAGVVATGHETEVLSPPAQATSQPDLSGSFGRLFEKELPWLEQFDDRAAETQPAGDRTELYLRSSEVVERLRPLAEQREEPQVAQLAAAWIHRIERWRGGRASSQVAREIVRQSDIDKARHARELEGIRRAREELTTGSTFDARGVLRPSFALAAGPYGLRYKLQDPFTHAVQAYVEFPTELGVDVGACVGKYVGVRGERRSEEDVGTTILRVTHITVLNPDKPKGLPTREKP